MTTFRILFLLAAFALGMIVDGSYTSYKHSHAANFDEQSDRNAIDRLHKLDEQITIMNDPKALQVLWTDDAVRFNPDGTADIGKAAILAADTRAFANLGFKIVSYLPQVKDLQLCGPWAFEWGSFTAAFQAAAGQPPQPLNGNWLRVLHRENSGDWKFARIMVSLKTP